MTRSKQHLLLGAHMSIAGGLEQALIRGASIGCSTIQLFTKNNRQWSSRELRASEIELFKQVVQTSSIKVIVAHASYLINVGSAQESTRKKSTAALADELRRCSSLFIPYLVLHPGSRTSSTEKECLSRIANNIDRALEQAEGNTMVLLETMAGQGSSVGATFEQLGRVRKLSKYPDQIGICFDTCHVFAAGYDFRDKKSYENIWKTFDATIGLKHLKVIHINDSKKDFGSRVDRHEHIGKGAIGINAFKLLVNDQRLSSIPKILETPKDSLLDDVKNMGRLRQLIKPL